MKEVFYYGNWSNLLTSVWTWTH